MLMNSEGGYTNGTYMMRKSKKWEQDEPQYLFSIVYKGTPTHHKVLYKEGFIAVSLFGLAIFRRLNPHFLFSLGKFQSPASSSNIDIVKCCTARSTCC